MSTQPNTAMKYGYGQAETVTSAKTPRKRCAYTGQGVHYHDGDEIFCSKECRKRDETDGPSR
jgi:hypothetical protein